MPRKGDRPALAPARHTDAARRRHYSWLNGLAAIRSSVAREASRIATDETGVAFVVSAGGGFQLSRANQLNARLPPLGGGGSYCWAEISNAKSKTSPLNRTVSSVERGLSASIFTRSEMTWPPKE